MIRYIIEKNNKLDFTNPLDIENPCSFDLKLLEPSTKIYIVDYTKLNEEYIISSSIKKSCSLVVKSIVNLYPNLIFSLNIKFWKNDANRLTLLKTCLKTLTKRNEQNNNKANIIKDFKKRYVKFLADNKIGGVNETELVY